MRSAKVCMLGDFAVGKTSTVARYVINEFSEKYLTTVGVKIDTKVVETAAGPLKLVIWDIAGTDQLGDIDVAYLRGSAGYIIVADGTRAATVDAALRLRSDAAVRYGERPFVALLNKSDLSDQWEVGEDTLDASRAGGMDWIECSAKTGVGIENAIQSLAERLALPGAPT